MSFNLLRSFALLLALLNACTRSTGTMGPFDAAGCDKSVAPSDDGPGPADSAAPTDLALAIPDAAPDSGPDAMPDMREADAASDGPVPFTDGMVWHECEHVIGDIQACGTWRWSAADRRFIAYWSNVPGGTLGFLDLVQSDGFQFVLRRTDPASPGFHADYTGFFIGGNEVRGTVVFAFINGPQSGVWNASW